MNDYSVEKILKDHSAISLPQCTYSKSRCYECIHFKKHDKKVDIQGKSHCAYWGEWRYPSDGCENGTDRWTFQKEQDEKAARRLKEIERKRKQEEVYRETEREKNRTRNNERSRVSYTGGTTGNTGGGGAGAGGVIFLVLAGVAILFSMGILKPTVTFKMGDLQLPSDHYQSYELNIVRMDNGSNYYPKNFKGYIADRYAFNEYGKSSVELKKGGYDAWISRDGISGFAGTVDVNNVFDKSVAVSPDNVQNGSIRMAMLYLRDQSRNAVVTENVMITDSDDNQVLCTRYKEDGCYILIIPDSDIVQTVITVTIQAEGYENCGLELDFSDGRTVDEKVTLTSK